MEQENSMILTPAIDSSRGSERSALGFGPETGVLGADIFSGPYYKLVHSVRKSYWVYLVPEVYMQPYGHPNCSCGRTMRLYLRTG